MTGWASGLRRRRGTDQPRRISGASARTSRFTSRSTLPANSPLPMRPARMSGAASSASALAVSTSVSSIAWRTPGFTSLTNTRITKNAARPTIRK